MLQSMGSQRVGHDLATEQQTPNTRLFPLLLGACILTQVCPSFICSAHRDLPGITACQALCQLLGMQWSVNLLRSPPHKGDVWWGGGCERP